MRTSHVLMYSVWFLFVGCQTPGHPDQPSHYLAITHSALNRISFFDLDRREVVGILPTQKLPHDMLLSRNRNTLFVVNSGAQCISSFSIKDPELWKAAMTFMKVDSAGIKGAPQMNMGAPHTHALDSVKDTYLHEDPVQRLPGSIVQHYLTDPVFPVAAVEKHGAVHAETHTACFDCHDRSVGGKPFGPVFVNNQSEIYLVHLAYRNLTVLDATTLSVKRQIPLNITSNFSPIEVWVNPQETLAFVTCRDEIGASLPGRILVVDLATGETIKSIVAGIYPWHLLPDPTGKRLYVNNFQSSRISVVDIERQEIVDSLVAQTGPAMMCFVPGTDLLLVSCFYTDNILTINTKTRVTESVIRVDTNPTSMELFDDNTKLYVLCGGESSLAVADLKSKEVIERHKLLFGAYAFHRVDQL